MSAFVRRFSEKWHAEVPGTRWFTGDLHIHTLDDHPASNFKYPQGINGSPTDPIVQSAYAKAFLSSAIKNGVEVLGLTPHAVKSGENDESSATWRIVEMWNNETDDVGIPFRDKIYAVFPGFEVNMVDGSEGLHLIYLFDPEIGRETFLKVYDNVMGGIQPYNGSSLRISPKRASEGFKALEDMYARRDSSWDYMCIAPHAFSNRGYFSLKAQVLELFPHHCISAIELKDNWLPEDAFADKHWLAENMKKHKHALYHASDAYSVENIGYRTTLIKLARPYIEALRQAFLASESRIRTTCFKDDGGDICYRSDLPDSCCGDRPWLKALKISGGTSFFAGINQSTGNPIEQTFFLNPDLNCIIGGRMSGKSTFLDGLRKHSGQDLPEDDEIRSDVEDRAEKRFLSGNPTVEVEIHGPINPSLSLIERWPAQFFSQRELQKAVRKQETRRQILYRLIPSETKGLLDREEAIIELDQTLIDTVRELKLLREGKEASEQELQRAKASKDALEKFEDAGIDNLSDIQSDIGKIETVNENLLSLYNSALTNLDNKEGLQLKSLKNDFMRNLFELGQERIGYSDLIEQYCGDLTQLVFDIEALLSQIENGQNVARNLEKVIKTEIQKALVANGGTAEELNQFDAMTQDASQYEKASSAFDKAKNLYEEAIASFKELYDEREKLIQTQRVIMDQVAELIKQRFPDQIKIQIEKNSINNTIDRWISDLREAGITRWWNSVKDQSFPSISPELILQSFVSDNLGGLGISPAVAVTFNNAMNSDRILELKSLRNEDKYHIQLKVGESDSDYRDIDELSGGAQVSVLLSLVLETDESTPLVIDQPEDEIDKAYLFDVLLPALHRLKGKRQVIFATHDANIVVNGDADNVIYLKASHDKSEIAEQGAIEDEPVKSAILKILDGGHDAFELRKAKYGF